MNESIALEYTSITVSPARSRESRSSGSISFPDAACTARSAFSSLRNFGKFLKTRQKYKLIVVKSKLKTPKRNKRQAQDRDENGKETAELGKAPQVLHKM